MTNVEFHLARMESMPLPDGSADCVISNCVINLAPDKPAVFREMFRVLKPGGRVAVSDIALKQPLPDELARSVAAYVGCIAGAIPIADYERMLREAGLRRRAGDRRREGPERLREGGGRRGLLLAGPELVRLVLRGDRGGGPRFASRDWHNCSTRFDVNEYAASVRVFAVKPVTSDTAHSP